MEKSNFNIVLLGIIFDPASRKILIGRREDDPFIPNLTWGFPGGKLLHGESIDKVLKKKIKEKTGYDVKNLGTIFSNTAPEKPDLFVVYFLCEVFKGKMKPGGDMHELKWVKPKELEDYRKRPLNSRLKEYIMNLQSEFCEDSSK